jgi:hypothetical protein
MDAYITDLKESLRSGVSPSNGSRPNGPPPGAPETLTGSASQQESRRLLRSQPRRLGFGQLHQKRLRLIKLCDYYYEVFQYPSN